jgi:short-subunit dehydrogenase
MKMPFEIAGKTVAVTGGSRGLGLQLAREFIARGASVALLARDGDELGRAVAELQTRGSAAAFACDVRDRSAVERAIAEVEQRLGPIDVLVNNAGVIQVGPLDALTLDDFSEAMNTHFWGPLYAMRAVLPGMRARRSGRIVNVSSVGGLIAVPHLIPYSASKFALTGLSQGMRAELARDGVSVTTVCPGLMRTGSPDHATFKGRNVLEYAWFAISDALPFVSTSVEEAARRIVEGVGDDRALIVTSVPAQVATVANAVLPELTARVLSLAAALLPKSSDRRPRSGAQSHSPVAPSPLTFLNERAKRTQNELA